jgi:hypothetical protein
MEEWQRRWASDCHHIQDRILGQLRARVLTQSSMTHTEGHTEGHTHTHTHTHLDGSCRVVCPVTLLRLDVGPHRDSHLVVCERAEESTLVVIAIDSHAAHCGLSVLGLWGLCERMEVGLLRSTTMLHVVSAVSANAHGIVERACKVVAQIRPMTHATTRACALQHRCPHTYTHAMHTPHTPTLIKSKNNSHAERLAHSHEKTFPSRVVCVLSQHLDASRDEKRLGSAASHHAILLQGARSQGVHGGSKGRNRLSILVRKEAVVESRQNSGWTDVRCSLLACHCLISDVPMLAIAVRLRLR